MVELPHIFLSVFPLIALIGLIVGGRLCVRFFFRRRKKQEPTNQCKCGYTLDNLSAARCPECGRVFGFDVTAEELGLSNEQLERAQVARTRRKADG